MRFMRVVSLVAGITLLAAGIASLIGRRAEVGEERDRRLESSASLLTAQLDATIGRLAAALTVATADTPLDRLADAVAGPVCSVTDGVWSCSSSSAEALADQDTAVSTLDAAGRNAGPVVVVDSVSGRVLVAADHGARRIIATAELDTADLPADMTAVLVPVAHEPLLRARTSGGQRLYASPSLVEFEDGSWAVRTSSAASVSLTADEWWLIGAQLAVGAALALVALGGIAAENRSLHRRATTDALTRLPNRAEFERRATETLTRLGRDGGAACVMVIDLDHFKVVNDTVGHDAGDRALVAAADRLRQAVRETDIVGRWGGDEFVVLLPGVVDVRAVPERAATIANAIAAAPPIGTFELTASVGAALFPAHGDSLECLLRAADRAMYAAKVQGVPHHLAEGRVAARPTGPGPASERGPRGR